MRRNRRIEIAATADKGRPWLQARSDVVPLHAFRIPEDTMTATTDHYMGIDVHKRQAQVAVLDDEGEVVEEVRVGDADLDEIAQEATTSRFTTGFPKSWM